MQTLKDVVDRLVDRDSSRSEATLQADVRALLLTAPFRLHEEDLFDVPLEAPVGGGRRIDVECGTTVFEIKRDLRVGNVRAMGVEQLSGYLEDRQRQMDRRYVGVLTDGVEWRCY